MNAIDDGRGYLPEQPPQLGGIEAVPANDAAVEQKDWDVESMTTL
jgi:hypothetical protein